MAVLDEVYKYFNEIYTKDGIKTNLDKDEYIEILCDITDIRLTDYSKLYLDCVFKRVKCKSFTKVSLLVNKGLYNRQFLPNHAIDGLIRINELGEYELVSILEETDDLIYKVKYCPFCGRVYRNNVSNCTKCGCALTNTNNIYQLKNNKTVFDT